MLFNLTFIRVVAIPKVLYFVPVNTSLLLGLSFLKETLEMAGFNGQQYNTHSFRIGRVTELANNGTTDRHQNHRSMKVYNLHGLHSPW